MFPNGLTDRLLALGTIVCLVLLVFLIVTNWEKVRPSTPAITQEAALVAADDGIDATAASVRTRPERPQAETKQRRPAAPAPVTIVAARGASWLDVRAETPDGDQLFVGTLEQGRSLKFDEARLWVVAGAAANLDFRAGERDLGSLPPGDEGVAQGFVTRDAVGAAATP